MSSNLSFEQTVPSSTLTSVPHAGYVLAGRAPKCQRAAAQLGS
jgi:hypothetical protein